MCSQIAPSAKKLWGVEEAKEDSHKTSGILNLNDHQMWRDSTWSTSGWYSTTAALWRHLNFSCAWFLFPSVPLSLSLPTIYISLSPFLPFLSILSPFLPPLFSLLPFHPSRLTFPPMSLASSLLFLSLSFVSYFSTNWTWTRNTRQWMGLHQIPET